MLKVKAHILTNNSKLFTHLILKEAFVKNQFHKFQRWNQIEASLSNDNKLNTCDILR